jgi:indole-3-glycerol phosphate synthase
MTTADLLETILAGTRRIVEVRQSREPLVRIASLAERRTPRRGAFKDAIARTGYANVIAECKRRSPSRGVLRADYAPVTLARTYAAAGAAAISVLTEPTFFDGSLDHLALVREAVALPLLRKDFIISEYQLFEARAAGADAVLLIAAALTSERLAALRARAADLELDALVEVHSDEELARAVDAGAEIVGVNNRNLRTLKVDLTASEALMARMPPGIIAISESGLRDARDLARLRALGYRAFLVGEHLMTASDPGAALRALIGPL